MEWAPVTAPRDPRSPRPSASSDRGATPVRRSDGDSDGPTGGAREGPHDGPLRPHPDVAAARTLDPRAHGDVSVHRALVRKLWPATWQLLRPGSFEGTACAFSLLPGTLDEPLVWTREDGCERLVSNVCTHRANLLLAEDRVAPCRARELVCGYHGRRFGLDGRMRSAPGFEGAADFPSPHDDLPRVELERLGPLAFTRLAPGLSFDVWSAPLAALLMEYEGEELRFVPEATVDHHVDGAWTLYVENYLEGFHVPFVHAGLHGVLDPVAYRTELLPHAVRQVGFKRHGSTEPCLRRAQEPGVVADYLWLWPNLMVNAYPFGLSVNVVEPTSPTTCRVRYLRWVARPELQERGASAALDRVEAEDAAVVASVQRGNAARLYRGGRFAPLHEQGTHWFQRLLGRELEACAEASDLAGRAEAGA
jgi:choline monooxygenase